MSETNPTIDHAAAVQVPEEGELLIIDGALGTEIELRGVDMEYDAWSARANLERPELVREVHKEYLQAGVDVIMTNTHSALEQALAKDGMAGQMETINRRGVEICLEAREAFADHPVAVAGAISAAPSFVKIDLPEDPATRHARLVDVYRRQALVLAEAGVDLIALEMIMTAAEGAAAIEGALETGLPVWAGVSVDPPDEQGVIWTLHHAAGAEYETRPFAELLDAIQGSGVTAVMVMHSIIDAVLPALDQIAARWDVPLGAYPHHGRWQRPIWINEDLSPTGFAREAQGWIEHGARWVGGCCGIGPAHIDQLVRTVRG